MKTVKEVSRISGVSVRTLHHYDRIGLFPPTALSEAGYRLYDDEALIRLQEILLFRELEFSLKEIKHLLTQGNEDRQDTLAHQIQLLEWKKSHLEKVIAHAKRLQNKGDDYMNFDVYDKAELEQLQAEAKEKWGRTAAFQEFSQTHSSEDFSQVSQEMALIMARFGQLKTREVSDDAVQACVKDLQDYITDHFYTCTKEVLAGLGLMYHSDDRFSQMIDKAGGPGTSTFVSQAIAYYCR